MSQHFIRVSMGAASLLALALLQSFGAGDAEAQTAQIYAADGFQIDFPGAVKITPQNAKNLDADAVRANYYLYEGSAADYAVMAVLYKTQVDLSSQNLSSFNTSYQCKATNRKTLQFPQGQALELSGTNCLGGNLNVATDYYAVGDWLYQITAAFPATDADSAAARQYLNSFKVVNAAAPAITWKKYIAAADGFQVDFSGDVKVTPLQQNGAATPPVRATAYAQEGSNFVYGVTAVLYAAPLANFDTAIKTDFATSKCKTTTKKSVQVASGHAVEYSGTDCLGGTLSAQVRFFEVGNWFYKVSAFFQEDDADVANAAHFVDSFEVAEGSQNPSANSYYFVSNTQPPDAYLSLRSEPSASSGHRIVTMPNGTLLDVLQRRPDGWWYVRIVSTGQVGWALSQEDGRVWISCCRSN
jgi:Bacterial SH3 domain